MSKIVVLILLFYSANLQAQITPRQYKSNIVIGTIGIGAGVSMIAGGAIIKDKVQIIAGRTEDHTKQARALFVTGSLFAGLGIAFSVKGAILRNKYFNTQITGNGVSLIFPIK